MSLLCSKLSHGSQLLRIKAIAPTMAQKSLHILDLSPSMTSVPVILSITHSSATLAYLLLLKLTSTLPLHWLCTCSHCLEHSSTQIIWWLAHPHPVFSSVTFLEKNSLTSISKLVSLTSTVYPLILLFVLCFSTKHRSPPEISRIYLLWLVSVSPQ